MTRVPSPDDDGERPFIARWNLLTRILLVDTSVKAVAYTAGTYADIYDGSRCRPGNSRVCRNIGASDNTVRKAWKTLSALGMAECVEPSHWNGRFRTADVYHLHIPGDWRGFATLGPREGRFRCLHCRERLFDPPPIAVLERNGEVKWNLARATFCRTTCRAAWHRREITEGRTVPWGNDSDRAWKLFHEARGGDDWPARWSAAA
jgi:hypothetical protein